MKKFRIILASSGLSEIWEEESIEDVKKILQKEQRKITPMKGNTAFTIPLTLQNTIIEEIE